MSGIDLPIMSIECGRTKCLGGLKMQRFLLTGAAVLALGLSSSLMSSAASAAPVTFTYTTGGDTTGSAPGPFTLSSTDSTYSVLRAINDQAFNFGDISNINLDYNVLAGGIGGGAPRLVVVTDADHNGIEDGAFSILLGPAGSFMDGTLGVANSGNLIAMNDVGRYDLGEIGGSFYTNYAAALAAAGSFGVLRLSLVLDSFGGADKTIVIPDGGFHVDAKFRSAVPEPGVWAMMIAGFGLMGVQLRRRRPVTTTAI